MREFAAVRNRNRCPSHPGALLRDTLENVDLTKQEIARRLHISRQQLHDIMTEKSRCLRLSPSRSEPCSAMAAAYGSACRPLTISGMRSKRSIHQRSSR